jgi:endonuclease YncB( thermonuclease family)
MGIVVVAGLLMAGEARLGGGTDGEETGEAEVTPRAATETPEAATPAATISDEHAAMIVRSREQAATPAPAASDVPAQRRADPAKPVESAAGEAARSGAEKGTELSRPVVENAGTLSFGERRLQLAGIIPTPVEKTCGPSGRQWPCGMMAKTALRMLLRNRSVTCDLDTADWKGAVTAACRLASQDLSTWLVENGWAEAAAGSPLAAASEKAKQARQGLYGDDPRRRQPTARLPPDAANPL